MPFRPFFDLKSKYKIQNTSVVGCLGKAVLVRGQGCRYLTPLWRKINHGERKTAHIYRFVSPPASCLQFTCNIFRALTRRSASLVAVPRRTRPYLRFGATPSATMANSYNSISPEGQPGLRTYIDGKSDGPTIVFVHGWPDDHALWDKQVMQKRCECTPELAPYPSSLRRAITAVYAVLRPSNYIQQCCCYCC